MTDKPCTWPGCDCDEETCTPVTMIACPKPEVCQGGGEHVWDGPEYVSEDGCLSSTTCSRCDTIAAYHDMWVGP